MSSGLIRGDALTIPLADNTVDLIVTSPPYFALRSYTDACGTCGGHAAGPVTGPSSSSTLAGNGHVGGGPKSKLLGQATADPDCPECEGSGRGHYAGQLGSEATPAAFIDALIGVTRECVRVLKPSGSLFVNLGDKYATSDNPNNGVGGGLKWTARHVAENKRVARSSRDYGGVRQKSLMGLPWRYALRCIDDLGLILRAEIIWSKPNGLPESVQDRVRRSHEQWFHFTLEPRYYSAVDEIREAQKYPDDLRHLRGSGYGDDMSGNPNSPLNPLGKLPGSVWTAEEDELWLPQSLAAEIMQRVADGEIDAQEAAGFLANDPPRTHEQWFHFTLEPRYYSAVDEIREPHTLPEQTGYAVREPVNDYGLTNNPNDRAGKEGRRLAPGTDADGHRMRILNPLGKLPGSVWTVPTEPLRVPDDLPQHFAAFPSEWPRRIILGWSPSGICCECGEGRTPVRGVASGETVLRRVLTTAEQKECGRLFMEWEATVVFDTAAISKLFPSRTGRLTGCVANWRLGYNVPTPEQADTIENTFGPLPARLRELVDRLVDVPARQRSPKNIGNGIEQYGHASGPTGTASITGESCACPTPTAPTRPAVVLDPFAGTGTTVAVANALGRYGVGVDLSADYLKLARWRCLDSGLRAKVLGVDRPAAEVPGQESLFTL